ncbi:hypothetical protein [Winogradskyella rapida]|uniref:TonB C-terminal domain-containing protein n=1 Tax=Winogradskyella rapida TaxID=549701 RepID=A0ABW3KP65_9FLAO
MKRILSIIILLVSTFGFATEQIPDILIWKNDTISLHSNPLGSYSKLDDLNLFGDKDAGYSTACWRGYIAEWKIIDNKLYLSNIYSCDYFYSENKTKADLKKLFPKKYNNGIVLANWYSGKLSVPNGKLINKELKIYESEWLLRIKKGQVINEKQFDNSSCHISIYTKNQDSLNHFITTNINWNKIPRLEKGIHKVYGLIKSGKSKTEFSLEIKSRTEYKELEKEALRILKLLPEFDFYIKAGEVINVKYTIPIMFNENNRPK